MQIVSRKFYLFLTSLPSAAVVLFYTFVIRAYFALGRFPRPYRPDPKELGFNIHMILIYLSIVLTLVGALPWLAVTIASWFKKSFDKKFLLIANIIYIISLIGFVIFFKFDPGRFMEWFMD